MPVQQMLVHLGVGALVLLANMALFHLRLVGGGDAKLISAAAVWLGYEQLVPYITYATIFGGALALLLLAYRRFPAGGLPLPAWAGRLHDPKRRHALRRGDRCRRPRRLPDDQLWTQLLSA